jgi:hypothetical protein
MTQPTTAEIQLYDQLMQVKLCVNALKDVSHNIPEDDTYSSVLCIVTERLDLELNNLSALSLLAVSEVKSHDYFNTQIDNLETVFLSANDIDKRHIIDKLDGIKIGIFSCAGYDNYQFKKVDTLYASLYKTFNEPDKKS